MSSQQKIDSARANGAKSRGPKTEAGRGISSKNAITHGVYSTQVVLNGESQQQYRQMLDAYIGEFQPQGEVEHHLIEDMVAAKWRQRRIQAAETELLNKETLKQKQQLDREDADYKPITPVASAYSALSMYTALPFLARAEARLERCYSRSLKYLLELQRRRNKAATPPSTRPEKENEETNPIPKPFQPPTMIHQPETRNQKPETVSQLAPADRSANDRRTPPGLAPAHPPS